jgi:hypothetical protein
MFFENLSSICLDNVKKKPRMEKGFLSISNAGFYYSAAQLQAVVVVVFK